MSKKGRILSFLLAIALAFTTVTTIAVVDDDATITAEAASIKLSATSKSIGYKQSFNLSIKNTGGKTVKWSTSNKKIAKITKVSKTKYKVTGVKPGKATIKAKVNGKTYKCKVTVSKLCHVTRTIAKGTSHTFGFKGANGKTVTWSIKDKSIASIKKVSNTKYKVTGKKKGTTTLKAKVNGKTYKCKITVTNPKLSETSLSMTIGDGVYLKVSGGKGTVTWSTTDAQVINIQEKSNTKYYVIGRQKGTATIKAKVDGKTLKCKVTVKKGKYKKYDLIKTEVYGCNNCGYPLFTRNSDGSVTNFSDMWSHPECTGEVVGGKTDTCTGGICGYHNEIYEYGYCYYCGDPISYRNCQWSARCQRCANNTGNGKTAKVVIDKSTDSDGSTRYRSTVYYKRCGCGKNTIMLDSNGKGMIKDN